MRRKLFQWTNKQEVGERIKLLTEIFDSERVTLWGDFTSSSKCIYTYSIAYRMRSWSEISLDCGYPASSLKERVYALSGTGERISTLWDTNLYLNNWFSRNIRWVGINGREIFTDSNPST